MCEQANERRQGDNASRENASTARYIAVQARVLAWLAAVAGDLKVCVYCMS
jgi:hypothetical protein